MGFVYHLLLTRHLFLLHQWYTVCLIRVYCAFSAVIHCLIYHVCTKIITIDDGYIILPIINPSQMVQLIIIKSFIKRISLLHFLISCNVISSLFIVRNDKS